MKKINPIFSAMALLLISVSVCGQDLNDARNYMQTMRISTDTSKLMTAQGLNIFMAKKVNTYLSGSGDLSLNKSYFIIDPVDGRLFLGMNFAKDPSEGNGRTQWIVTTGLKADATDNFSTLFNAEKDEISPNIGLSLKLTWLGRGIISYGVRERQIQKNQLGIVGPVFDTIQNFDNRTVSRFLRKQISNQLDSAMRKDSSEFVRSLDGFSGFEEESWATLQKSAYFKAANKKYRKEFITKEAEVIDDKALYSWYWTHWFSAEVYVPFTRSRYDVAGDFTSDVEEKRLYNLDATLLWSQVMEGKAARLITSIGPGVKIQNNINTATLSKYGIGEYKKLGGQDTLKLAELSKDDVYVGQYEEYVSPFVKMQAVCFFVKEKSIGLSFAAEKFMGGYDPLNIKLGVPVSLKGKDDETKVNFELQFKWNDYGNNIFPEKSRSDKFVIGLSIGIPLISKLY